MAGGKAQSRVIVCRQGFPQSEASSRALQKQIFGINYQQINYQQQNYQQMNNTKLIINK